MKQGRSLVLYRLRPAVHQVHLKDASSVDSRQPQRTFRALRMRHLIHYGREEALVGFGY